MAAGRCRSLPERPIAKQSTSSESGAHKHQHLKVLIGFEHAHAFSMSIFGGVEHFRAEVEGGCKKGAIP
jgi:hypothetical protein